MDDLGVLLDHLDISELKELVNDEEVFNNFTKDAAINSTKDALDQKQMLLASNKSLAEYNLSQEPALIERKEQLRELSAQVETLSKSIQDKISIIKSHKNNLNSDTVLALLQTAAYETEEESEKIADQFLNGSLDMDAFLDTFIPKRILMHARKNKATKMTEMLTKRSSYPSPNVSNGHPYGGVGGGGIPSYPSIPSASSSPGYPLGGLGMPLPSHHQMPPYPQIPVMPKPYYQ